MKVLYIDGIGQFGGASRSLFELMRSLRELGVQPHCIGAIGTVEPYYDSVAEKAIYARGITRFNNSITGYYRGLRWLILLREFRNLPYTMKALRQAKREFGPVDLIHINEIHDLPAGLIAKYHFRVPLIVHLRCRQRCVRRSLRARGFAAALRRWAAIVIPIDQTTASSLPAGVPTKVVHNSLSVPYTPPYPKRERRAGNEEPITVGFVGNVMRSKGVLDLVESIAILKARGVPVRLKIVGGRLRQLRGFRRRLLQFGGLEEDALPEALKVVEAKKLSDLVTFCGHVDDIHSVLPTIDVLAFPSYYDAPGRPIFEAAFYRIPSIACIRNPKDDTFQEGITGIAVAPGAPEQLASALEFFSTDRDAIKRMGDAAYELAWANCEPKRNAEKVRAVYERVLNERREIHDEIGASDVSRIAGPRLESRPRTNSS
jgi:glycosyltransferase involved in cell wall biosynthesis